MREYYWKEVVPMAIAIGIAPDEFWHMNPRILNACIEGHKKKMEELDTMNWYLGQYQLCAVSVALDNAFNGKKAKTKYIEKPFLLQAKEKNEPKSEQSVLDEMVRNEMLWIQHDKMKYSKSQG